MEGDVFFRQVMRAFASREVDWRDRWRRFSRNGCLMGWRPMGGVLEDSLRFCQSKIGKQGKEKLCDSYVPLGRLLEGLGGS